MRSLIGPFFAIAIAIAANAGTSPAPETVAPGISVLRGQLAADRSPDGNSEIIRGPKGLIVVDSGRGGVHTDLLLAAIAATGLQPKALINTHWHLDHIGGNPRFRATWPELHIYAAPGLDEALTGFHADYRRQLEEYVPTLPAGSADRVRYEAELALLAQGRALAETDAVRAPTTLNASGRPLDLHIARHAVTEGDLWLHDRQTRTLIAGDLVTLPVPLFDSACPEGWQRALADLSKTGFARLVPGHGAPLRPTDFRRYRQAFDHLLACAADDRGAKACADGWFRDAGSLVETGDEAYGRKLLAYYYDGFLKPGAAGRARWCPTHD